MKIKTIIIATLALLVAMSGYSQSLKNKKIYDFTVKDIKGNDVSLADYKGKVLLIVNVASKCGLTPQYEGFEALYLKYKDQGLEILAFPCNQFLEQEPGTNEEILDLCSINYNVTFPLFDKIDVNGKEESPLYTFLKAKAPFKGNSIIVVENDGLFYMLHGDITYVDEALYEDKLSVAFEDLPEDWKCPRCRQGKEKFNRA